MKILANRKLGAKMGSKSVANLGQIVFYRLALATPNASQKFPDTLDKEHSAKIENRASIKKREPLNYQD